MSKPIRYQISSLFIQNNLRPILAAPKISVKNYMSDKIGAVGPVDGNSLNGTFDVTRGKFVAL